MSHPRSFLWLSGWSLPGHIWDEQISFWPHAVHEKVDFTQCTQKEDFTEHALHTLLSLPAPVCLVAWSLGAFVTLDMLTHLTQNPHDHRQSQPDDVTGESCAVTHQKAVIHSIFLAGVGSQFVRTTNYPHGWDPRILQRMKKQLKINQREVLNQFDLSMLSPFNPQSWYQSIRERSRQSSSSLLAGLNYLLHFCMSQPNINSSIAPIFILAGAQDQITPLAGAKHLSEHLPARSITTWEHANHIPFRTHPQLFHQWMQNNMRSTS